MTQTNRTITTAEHLRPGMFLIRVACAPLSHVFEEPFNTVIQDVYPNADHPDRITVELSPTESLNIPRNRTVVISEH